MNTYLADEHGYYGIFGGAYIPEILHSNVENLKTVYLRVFNEPSFQEELGDLLRDYA